MVATRLEAMSNKYN